MSAPAATQPELTDDTDALHAEQRRAWFADALLKSDVNARCDVSRFTGPYDEDAGPPTRPPRRRHTHVREREHLNANGSPKRAWPSRAAANVARRSMSMSHVNIYCCTVCGLWHHGHREPRRDP